MDKEVEFYSNLNKWWNDLLNKAIKEDFQLTLGIGNKRYQINYDLIEAEIETYVLGINESEKIIRYIESEKNKITLKNSPLFFCLSIIFGVLTILFTPIVNSLVTNFILNQPLIKTSLIFIFAMQSIGYIIFFSITEIIGLFNEKNARESIYVFALNKLK